MFVYSGNIWRNFFLADIDGGWGDWGSWQQCDQSCGGGKQYRYRLCNSPPSVGDGNPCPGSDEEHRECNTQKCVGTDVSFFKTKAPIISSYMLLLTSVLTVLIIVRFMKQLNQILIARRSVYIFFLLRTFNIHLRLVNYIYWLQFT